MQIPLRLRQELLALPILLLGSCGNGLLSFVPIDIDKSLGEQSQLQINASPDVFKILGQAEYHETYKGLNNIRDKIVSSGKLDHKKDFPWELKIIEDDSVLNAFCLPGGYIYVYTGLIKYLDTEDALAGVIGHEMAHADLRHGTKQMLENSGLSLITRLIFGVDNSTLVGIGQNLISLSFSRDDESAADMKSVEMLYETDYDARGVSRFFEKIQLDKKDQGVIEFVSTHPSPENRVENISEKWKQLGAKKGKTFKIEYSALKNTLP